MMLTTPRAATDWGADLETLRCVACAGALREAAAALECSDCAVRYPLRDGVLVVKEEPTDDNKIAAEFYNGPLWPKFRFWEWFFFVCNGGEQRARNVILRHLPPRPGLNLLDVAIGDGAYVGWLPGDWSITGIDVSSGQLASCRQRNSERALRLVLGEAETMPFRERRFDAVLSIGGFNHFNDPEGALREMVRVARPRGTIVISDELPDLTERMIGHKLGFPGFDRWCVSRLMHLGDAFTDLVERHRKINIEEIGRRVLTNCRYERIWRGGGYVMVGQAPAE